MVSVEIRIVTTPITDYFLRYHGKAVDEPLDISFWITQPGNIIATTGAGFTDTQTVELVEGTHYVIYGNSGGGADYVWHAQLFINGILVAEGDVHRHNQLMGNFTIKDGSVIGLPPREVESVTLISSGSRHTTPEQGSIGTSLSTKRTRIVRHITWLPVVVVRA